MSYKIDKTNIEKVLRHNRPRVSDSTITTYVSCIQNIAKGAEVKITCPKDFETHFDPIMKYLMSLKPNIRKTKIASLVVLIDDKHSEHSKELVDCLEKYRAQMFSDTKVVDADAKKQELTESQKANYIPWEEVLEIYKNLKEEIQPLLKLEKLTPRQFFLMQDYVLLSCYVLIEPRRSKDYCDFKIRNYDDASIKSDDNYMQVTSAKRGALFVFNSYKNSGKLGTQVVEIPKELKLIINKWATQNPYDYLIVKTSYKKMDQASLTKIFHRIFQKDISSSMLRHIFLTHMLGDVDLETLSHITHNMGNSNIQTILEYVQKNPSKVIDDNKKNLEDEK